MWPSDGRTIGGSRGKVADVKRCTLESDADHILGARFGARFVGKCPWFVDLYHRGMQRGLGGIVSRIRRDLALRIGDSPGLVQTVYNKRDGNSKKTRRSNARENRNSENSSGRTNQSDPLADAKGRTDRCCRTTVRKKGLTKSRTGSVRFARPMTFRRPALRNPVLRTRRGGPAPCLKLSRDYLQGAPSCPGRGAEAVQGDQRFWLQRRRLHTKVSTLSKERTGGSQSGGSPLPLLCTRLTPVSVRWSNRSIATGPLMTPLAAMASLMPLPKRRAEPRSRFSSIPVSHDDSEHEYLRAAVLQTSSLDALPAQIELAERLRDYYLPGFMMAPQQQGERLLGRSRSAQPPVRLARMPKQVVSTPALFPPARAHPQVPSWCPSSSARASAGRPKFGRDRSRHSAARSFPSRHCWAPSCRSANTRYPVAAPDGGHGRPVQRHRRHGRARRRRRWNPGGGETSAAVVSARVGEPRAEWFKIGSLLGMQPEGGEKLVAESDPLPPKQ